MEESMPYEVVDEYEEAPADHGYDAVADEEEYTYEEEVPNEEETYEYPVEDDYEVPAEEEEEPVKVIEYRYIYVPGA